jgi:nucleotide-binding universal stress UspA family protein
MKTDKKKKIIIALDYDPSAQSVAEAGIALGKALKVDVVLLHVIADATYYSALEYSPVTGFAGYLDVSKIQLNSVEGLKNASQKYLDKLKQHFGYKTVQTIIGEGDSAKSVLKTAKELDAGIIVMGSHSRNWLENIVMGSVTSKVIQETSIPVFIVPIKKRN